MRQLLNTYTRALHLFRQRAQTGLFAVATLLLFLQAITAANATGFVNDVVIINGQRNGTSFGPNAYATNGSGGPSI
ncbi:MAG: hypothetical protein EOO61_09960, partial [Hymenobacter sp.]